MGAVPISVATDDYDRVQAVKSGRVPIEGCEVTYLTLSAGELFFRLFTYREFDVAEMSFSTYLLARSRGDWPYRAVPVFLSRVFPHGSIYIRTDRGIAAPADLKGRVVGVPSYHFTRGLCARGVLRDEYGVEPPEIAWRVGGVDEPEEFDYVGFDPPSGLDLRRVEPGQTLGGLLRGGAIDGIISYRDPRILHDGTPNVGRLFPDFRSVERAYYTKTGIFPIMHVIGIHDSLLERHPWIARSVVKAFDEARALALPRLTDLNALMVTLPWLVAEARDTIALMGEDYWPYGLERNRLTLEAQMRWSHEQGLSPRSLGLEELFVPSTLRWFR